MIVLFLSGFRILYEMLQIDSGGLVLIRLVQD
jgi:hypothetical protein